MPENRRDSQPAEKVSRGASRGAGRGAKTSGADVGASGLSVSTRVLLVSQNFVVLFVLSIVAFWRVNSGWSRWLFSLGGAGVSLFLMSGFSYLALFPAALLGLGYCVDARSRRAGPAGGRR